ncbi:MAG: MBL fold metallo-hydrolase, partial [Megamonas funiformis]|uniref:MBL fold metallo-hydrolase n=1 Tax=Megamonas funiformis TaxID=437897 RepID=UPI001EB7897E
MIKFKYYGHACFLLETDNEKLLFDPFLTGNPVASISADEVKCDYILLTHAHGDHYGDATQIEQKTGAKVISTPEVLTKLPSDYENVHGMNIGGKANFDFGSVKFVQAFHSSSFTHEN